MTEQDYTLTWCPRGEEPVTVPLRDVTPDGVLDAAAGLDMPCDWFTDTFLYRLLYSLVYQLWCGKVAAVFELPGGGTVTVRRATV